MQESLQHIKKNNISKHILWLLIGISGLCGLGWVINTIDPAQTGALVLFFCILFVTVYGFIFFLTRKKERALLWTIGIVLFFLLRFFGLREWLYPVLLIACLISLEILFQKR